ncbi:MAG: TolB family protein [Aggregatilineales bacterium]
MTIQAIMKQNVFRGLVGLAAIAMLLAGVQGQIAQAAVPVQSCVSSRLTSTGSHLALVSVQNHQQSINLANADGSGRACIATLASTAQAQLPAWSADGKYIAFVLAYSPDGSLSSAFTLYVINSDGSNPHPISARANGLSFSWSPDSQHLVYSSQGHLTVTDLTGGATPLLKNNEAGDFSPAWSPDGMLIAYSRNDGLYVVNADGSNAHNISNLAHNLPDSADQSPVWSPNSKQIAFRSTRDGIEQVYVVKADGSGLTRMSDLKLHNDMDRAISWSPDNKQLAFTARTGATPQTGHVMIVNADGTALHRLTQSANGETNPCWSSDGKWMAFEVDLSRTQQNVYVTDLTGVNLRNLTVNPLSDVDPIWQP